MSRGCSGEAGLDESQERVIEEPSVGQGRKAYGLGHGQEVSVPVQEGKREGHGRLFPRRTPPNDGVARTEHVPGGSPFALDRHLACGHAGPPLVLGRVSITRREMVEDRAARVGGPDALAVLMARVHGGSRAGTGGSQTERSQMSFTVSGG